MKSPHVCGQGSVSVGQFISGLAAPCRFHEALVPKGNSLRPHGAGPWHASLPLPNPVPQEGEETFLVQFQGSPHDSEPETCSPGSLLHISIRSPVLVAKVCLKEALWIYFPLITWILNFLCVRYLEILLPRFLVHI